MQPAPLLGRVVSAPVHTYVTRVIRVQAGSDRRGQAVSTCLWRDAFRQLRASAPHPRGWSGAAHNPHTQKKSPLWLSCVTCAAWCACSTPSVNRPHLKVNVTVWPTRWWKETKPRIYRSPRWCTHLQVTAACQAWIQHQKACRGSGSAHGWCSAVDISPCRERG